MSDNSLTPVERLEAKINLALEALDDLLVEATVGADLPSRINGFQSRRDAIRAALEAEPVEPNNLPIECSECAGTGTAWRGDTLGDDPLCPACGGSGLIDTHNIMADTPAPEPTPQEPVGDARIRQMEPPAIEPSEEEIELKAVTAQRDELKAQLTELVRLVEEILVSLTPRTVYRGHRCDQYEVLYAASVVINPIEVLCNKVREIRANALEGE